MSQLNLLRRERTNGAALEPRQGSGGVVAIIVFVVAMAALGEFVADRASVRADAPHGSSWQPVQRIADEALGRRDAPAARRAYLTMLFRARGERSVVGVLSAAEGFKALGDREVVERALAIAAALAPDGDPAGARRRLTMLRDRLDATDALPIVIHAQP
jgi:hypothetical protein